MSIDASVEAFQGFTKEQNKGSGVDHEFGSIGEVGEALKNKTPGVIVFDSDFTLKTKEYELGLGGFEPGRMPDDSMKLLSRLKADGWRILVVSNQPREGHQVARMTRDLGKLFRKRDYPIFPDSVAEIVGKENVKGGGWNFLWKKYKATPEAIDETASLIEEKLGEVVGQVYFVGDRETDVVFAQKIKDKLAGKIANRTVNIWKVKGLSVPKILQKFIP